MNPSILDISLEGQVVSGLARTYNTLDYILKLRNILSSVYPSFNFQQYNKFDLHKVVNETILNNYNGEEILKYSLFQEFYKKNVVAAFEMNVNNSRIDFLTINGDTKSFEIKSGIDNLQKLKKQISDYIRAFEYNYVVIDEKHLEKVMPILPETYGIWSFSNLKKKVHRRAELNTQIDCEYQLSLLTKKEIHSAFKEPIHIVLKHYSAEQINVQFKNILKGRYKTRWDFIVTNNANILPIDLQFFFNTNISPELIYQG